MTKYLILYDEEKADLFKSNIEPILEGVDYHLVAFRQEELSSLNAQESVIVWLGDEALYYVLKEGARLNWSVGFLPHPEMNRIYHTYPFPSDPRKALDEILSCETPVEADFLYCNDRLVFSSVLLGNPELMKPASLVDESIWCKVKNLALLILKVSKMTLVPFKLTTAKDTKINTAALGISVVYRPRASDFTKRVVGVTERDESTLDAVILAPRSRWEVLHFLFTKVLPKRVASSETLPNYIGHLRTESIEITNSKELHYSIDGTHHSAECVNVKVEPNQLKILGTYLPEKSQLKDIKETVRISRIPRGEAVAALADQSLPFIQHVDQDEIKEVFMSLKQNAQSSESYKVLMVLSTLLATVGLFANSAPVIIGAMILAPLMSPIISLSMGVLRQNVDLILTSAKTLFWGVFLSLLFGTFVTLLMPLYSINSEISARLSPTLLDMGVAIVSGIAAAYASARLEVAKSLAGVAIAVALVPPLAVSAVGIGWWDWSIFMGAFLLFLTNLVGILLASSATFLVLGFSPFHLAKKGLLISLVFVGLVSIPLIFGFNSLVREQQVANVLNDMALEGIHVREVKIRSGTPLFVSAKLVSDHTLTDKEIESVKQRIETRLERKIQLEAVMAVVK